MKIFVLSALLLSNVAFAQSSTKFIGFKEYPNSVASLISIEIFPSLLLDKTYYYKAALGRMPFKFVSLSEFEEVRGKNVYNLDGKMIYYVTVLANDYANKSKKYLFEFRFEYIDSREGLILQKIDCLSGQKMN